MFKKFNAVSSIQLCNIVKGNELLKCNYDPEIKQQSIKMMPKDSAHKKISVVVIDTLSLQIGILVCLLQVFDKFLSVTVKKGRLQLICKFKGSTETNT